MKKYDEIKILVSLRIKSKYLDRVDMLAYWEDRSRNFIFNRLIGKILKHLEIKHGKIVVNQSILEKFRNRRNRRGTKRSPKSDSDKRN